MLYVHPIQQISKQKKQKKNTEKEGKNGINKHQEAATKMETSIQL